MSGHTPGPWHITEDFGMVYALMSWGWRKGVEQFKNRFAAAIHHDASVPREEAEADARLIAAAPELLSGCRMAIGAIEALKALREDIPGPAGLIPGLDAVDGTIRAAVAKAEGK